MRTKLRSKFTLFFIVCAALLAFASTAMALTTDTGGSTAPAPTIQSDKADYAPGELVTLTGGGWQPGESVHINVNDTYGASWARNVDVTADASGNVTDSFNLPDWFVSDYDVTATGAQSGTATTTFTDSITDVSATLDGGSSVTVLPGTNISAAITATAKNSGGAPQDWKSTGWVISNTAPAETTKLANCVDTADVAGSGGTGTSATRTFNITAPNSTGTYNVYFELDADDGAGVPAAVANACGAGSNNVRHTMTSVVTVKANQDTLMVTSPTSGTYGEVLPIQTSGGSGTGALSFSTGTSTACQIVNGDELEITSGTGTCSVTATKAGDATYFPTTSAAQPVEINKANATIDVQGFDGSYDGNAHGATTATATGINDEDLGNLLHVSGSFTNAPGGTGSWTFDGNTNYNDASGTFEVKIARANITVTAVAQSKVQGQPDPTLTYQVTGKPANGVDVSGTLTREPGDTPGTYPILQNDVTNANNSNYNITYVGANLTITAAPVAYSGSFLQPINGGLTPAISGMSAADAATAFSNDDSRFKLGSTVPVKFQLKNASGAPVTNVGDIRLFVMQADNKPDPGVSETISTVAATDGNLFRLVDATTGTYMFNLSTKSGYLNPGATTPTAFTSQGTYKLSAVVVQSGTSYSVNIQLVK